MDYIIWNLESGLTIQICTYCTILNVILYYELQNSKCNLHFKLFFRFALQMV